jgi:hypothetical protein
LREVRIGIYRQDLGFIKQQMADYQKYGYPSQPVSLQAIFQRICNSPFDSDWCRTLSPEFYAQVITSILNQGILTLTATEEPFALLQDDCAAGSEQCTDALRGVLIEQLLLRGQVEEVSAVLAQISDPLDPAVVVLRGWHSFIQGHNQEALTHYTAAFQTVRKPKGKRQAYISAKGDSFGSWHCSKTEHLKPDVPSTLQAELRDYQLDGFRWLAQLAHWGAGACLADDMGLGKTLQALAMILTHAPQGPTLVVAPTSVGMNWESEAQRFAPTLNVLQFGSSNRQQLLDQLQPFDLLICSYGLLQQEDVAAMLAQVQWQIIVLDEAQAIKNMATKRSQAAMTLQGKFKLITTGTPIENHLGELRTKSGGHGAESDCG